MDSLHKLYVFQGSHTFSKTIFHVFSIRNDNFIHQTQRKKTSANNNGKEQNPNKHMAEFGISILFQYFLCVLEKFNTFAMS